MNIGLTIHLLDSVDVVTVKLHIRDIASVKGVHDGFVVLRVTQSKTVTELVHGNPEQVHSGVCSKSESLVLIKVRITRDTLVVMGIECMGQRSTFSIKRIAVSMVTTDKLD